MSINSLADVPGFAGRRQVRRPPAWRSGTVLAVIAIHLAFFLLLVISMHAPIPLLERGNALETILYLNGATQGEAPAVSMAEPERVNGAPPQIITAPITLPPRPNDTQDDGATGTPGDLLGALGRGLACTANNFEHLNQAQRNRCRFIPWQGAKMPDGVIVLAPQGPSRFAPPPPEFQISGADARRREIETASPCPVMLNVPCLNKLPSAN